MLEERGLHFASFVLGQRPSETASPRVTAEQLMADPGYASIVTMLKRDLAEIAAQDRSAGVGMRYAHRLFDAQWLASPRFHYELIGVVNRVDRRVFHSGCGELRLIYRLAYASEVAGHSVASRVPFTFNAVRYVTEEDCKAHLGRWRMASHAGAAAVDALLGPNGPLSPSALARTEPKSVEVNFQSMRWPSTVRPNMAGHAEYVLRAFTRTSDSEPFTPLLLENTPDVEGLQRDPKQRAQLLEWLKQPTALDALDLGILQIPERFLATRAVSVAPRGLARVKNRPYAQLFSAKDFDTLELKDRRTITSPEALLRRLDTLSCQGCHQSQSIAGFHVLGRDAPTHAADALALPHSAHFTDDMQRRMTYAAALLSDAAPSELRPSAERASDVGKWGARCGLAQDASAPFAQWKCAPGLECRQVDDPELGHCMPTEPQIGDACELGTTDKNSNAYRDFTRLNKAGDCGPERRCEINGVGFPGGMCASSCNAASSEATCGAIAILDGFNACLALRKPFATCLADNTRPAALRACSHEAPCRDDYVCAQSGSGGACIPPYFLFQLRVDGHVY